MVLLKVEGEGRSLAVKAVTAPRRECMELQHLTGEAPHLVAIHHARSVADCAVCPGSRGALLALCSGGLVNADVSLSKAKSDVQLGILRLQDAIGTIEE